MLLLIAVLSAFAADPPAPPPAPPAPPPPAAADEAASMDEDDGADLDAEEGHLSESAVPTVIKKNEWALTDCHSRLGGRSTGRAVLKWEIGITGAAANVKLAESDLKNPMLEECLVKAVGRMKFPTPRGGAAHVSHTFNF